MKTTSKLIIFIFALLALTTSANAQTPREELQQMVEQLQTSPNDNALREKIIKLAISIKPAPAIPEEAREPFVMGATMLKKASDPAGASKAVDLFTQALNIAPWFADAYYNRAIAREAAGQYEPAIDDLKHYLGFKLTDSERREAQDKIYALKAEVQLASAKRVEEVKAATAERAKPDFSGRWGNDQSNRYEFTPEGGGAVSVRIILWNETSFTGRAHIEGRTLTGTWDQTVTSAGTMCPSTYSGALSEDNQLLDWTRTSHCGGDPMKFSLVLTREK
jgi:tetratricopeptide (TPR) repeat protein